LRWIDRLEVDMDPHGRTVSGVKPRDIGQSA
jgi:hypothetical protein